MLMYESFDYSTTTHAIPSVSEWLVYPSTISLVKLPPIEVIKLIYWLKLVEIADIIYISNKFSKLFDHLRPLFEYIIVNVDLYLRNNGIYVYKYVLDVYDLGEGGYSEVRPFVEVYVGVEDVDRLLDVWKNVIRFLEALLGDDVLDHIDVFFTRA